MSINDKINRILNTKQRHSAHSIGLLLGIDAEHVESHIQSLLANGLTLECSEQEYRLAPEIKLLDAEEIAKGLHPQMPLQSFEIFQSIESTNSHLLSKPVGVGGMSVCLTESQSAGRGRRGNTWVSAPYRNVMLSVSWGFKQWPATISALSLAVGLCVAEKLNSLYGLNVKIKWPNDLMVGDAKLAGILIDVTGQSQGPCSVVIGLGLNVNQPEWSRDEADYRWQDLAGLGADVDRNEMLSAILNDLVELLTQYEDSGFAPLRERWNQLSSYQNRRISVGREQQITVGVMQGVDASGALLLMDDNGKQHSISDSNLSVRLL